MRLVVRRSVVNGCGFGIIRSNSSDRCQCNTNRHHCSDRQAGAGASCWLCWLSWHCSGFSSCWGRWISWGCWYGLGKHLARYERHGGEDGDNFLHMNSFGLKTVIKYNTIDILSEQRNVCLQNLMSHNLSGSGIISIFSSVRANFVRKCRPFCSKSSGPITKCGPLSLEWNVFLPLFPRSYAPRVDNNGVC